MIINKFGEYNRNYEIANEFVNSFQKMIFESEQDSGWKFTEKKIIGDLKLNLELILTFGAGIAALYPIVQNLMTNMNIASIEVNKENVVLLTLASITIIFLDEKRHESEEQEIILTKNSKSMLEELKLRGIGNGIVKQTIKAISSIKNIFSLIAKHLGTAINGIIDMFAYTSLLIPIMNGLQHVIGHYNLNFDTLAENFLGLAMGIGTIISKHGISYIVNKLKNKFKINKKEITDEIETPVIQKFSSFSDGESEQNGELINEQ